MVRRVDGHSDALTVQYVPLHKGYLFGYGQCILPSMMRMFLTLKSPL
jgi:hypothetical protein